MSVPNTPLARRFAPEIPKPSIGSIVHYHSYGTPNGEFKPEPRAAIITAVRTRETTSLTDAELTFEVTHVSLCVLNPTGMFFTQDLPFSEDPKPGHWSWPPRA